MAKIVQMQYVPRSKREKDARLLILDDEGSIWYIENPFSGGATYWQELVLPPHLTDDEEDDDSESEEV